MNFTLEPQLSQPSATHGAADGPGAGDRCFKAYLRSGTKNRHIGNTSIVGCF